MISLYDTEPFQHSSASQRRNGIDNCNGISLASADNMPDLLASLKGFFDRSGKAHPNAFKAPQH